MAASPRPAQGVAICSPQGTLSLLTRPQLCLWIAFNSSSLKTTKHGPLPSNPLPCALIQQLPGNLAPPPSKAEWQGSLGLAQDVFLYD